VIGCNYREGGRAVILPRCFGDRLGTGVPPSVCSA
jgi:hypothetical protein